VTHALVFRPEAAEEARAARQWYEKQQQGLGAQFANAIDEVIRQIVSNPLAFPLIHAENRRAIVRRFPYGVYFPMQLAMSSFWL
jgi:hypothetical protein